MQKPVHVFNAAMQNYTEKNEIYRTLSPGMNRASRSSRFRASIPMLSRNGIPVGPEAAIDPGNDAGTIPSVKENRFN